MRSLRRLLLVIALTIGVISAASLVNLTGQLSTVEANQIGLVLALLLVIVLLAWDLLTRKTPPADEPPPAPPKRTAQRDPLRKANDAEDFARRMKDRARRRIDSSNGGNGKHG